MDPSPFTKKYRDLIAAAPEIRNRALETERLNNESELRRVEDQILKRAEIHISTKDTRCNFVRISSFLKEKLINEYITGPWKDVIKSVTCINYVSYNVYTFELI